MIGYLFGWKKFIGGQDDFIVFELKYFGAEKMSMLVNKAIESDPHRSKEIFN